MSNVPVSRDGTLEIDAVCAQLRPNETRLVSLMAASNETGVLLPVRDVAQTCRKLAPDCLIHTDAVQLVGRAPVNVRELGVHLLSFAGHKLGAVGGVGVLVVERGVQLAPIWHGAGLPSGADNVAGCVSLAVALRAREYTQAQHIAARRDRLEALLCAALDNLEIIGARTSRLGNTSSIRFGGCEGDAIMMALDIAKIAVSTGSACSSGAIEPSPVLMGMGFTADEAKQVVRFSLSASTSDEDVDTAVRVTVDIVRRMRG